MEEELFTRRRLYFEGAGGQTLGRRGFSKDHRPDLNQMILAVSLDGDRRPVCTEMGPGNTADVSSSLQHARAHRERMRFRKAGHQVFATVTDQSRGFAPGITRPGTDPHIAPTMGLLDRAPRCAGCQPWDVWRAQFSRRNFPPRRPGTGSAPV
jgi:hypothetical protein